MSTQAKIGLNILGIGKRYQWEENTTGQGMIRGKKKEHKMTFVFESIPYKDA